MEFELQNCTEGPQELSDSEGIDGGKNVRVICTVQLSKAYTLQRYLSQESLAESKNIIDVCSKY